MTALLAVAAGVFWGYTLTEVLIGIVIVAAAVALLYIALREFGIAIPPWVIQVFWVIMVAVVVVFAIRLVTSL